MGLVLFCLNLKLNVAVVEKENIEVGRGSTVVVDCYRCVDY